MLREIRDFFEFALPVYGLIGIGRAVYFMWSLGLPCGEGGLGTFICNGVSLALFAAIWPLHYWQ
jgi:hypothetical protein